MPPRRTVRSLYATDRPKEPEPRQRRGTRPSRTELTIQTLVEEAAAMEVEGAGGSSSTSADEPTAGDEASAGDEATEGGIHFLYCVDHVLAWSHAALASTNSYRGPPADHTIWG